MSLETELGSLLEETEQENVFKAPADTSMPLWRYVDFTKFVSMLAKRELFFPTLRTLNAQDKFEGTLPVKNLKKMEDRIKADYKNQRENTEAVRNPLLNDTTEVSMLKQNRYVLGQLRDVVAVSCWHANEHESAAMWRLYLKSDEGVAIGSTYAKLRACLDDSVNIGGVEYIDFENDEIKLGPVKAALIKRKSFEHEKEWRAVITGQMEGKPGKGVSIDLETLIEEVRVAPTAAGWFAELVESVCVTYKLKKKVKSSFISLDPPY